MSQNWLSIPDQNSRRHKVRMVSANDEQRPAKVAHDRVPCVAIAAAAGSGRVWAFCRDRPPLPALPVPRRARLA
jgi:hypothetical protein